MHSMHQLIQKIVGICFGLCLLWASSGIATAQNIQDYITIEPVKDWVVVQDISDEAFDLSKDQKLTYKLVSRQHNVSKLDHEFYSRYVMDLHTASAVEEEGTITVTFNPAYERIKFHHIKITDENGTRSVQGLEEGELFRTETEREKLLYDGSLQYSLALRGIKVGDRLDYALTRIGKNPDLGDGYFSRQSLAYSTPVQHLYRRSVIAPDVPVYIKLQGGAKPVKKSVSEKGEHIIEFDQYNIPATISDDDRPSWHYGWPLAEVSSYASWDDVGNHFAPFYEVTQPIPSEIMEVVENIKKQSDDPEVQTRLALNYVQENIRYLSLDLAVGGFKPRNVSEIFDRKFGDCKDVTMLLLTLLSGLNIEATPVLVHTEERSGFVESQPGHYSFDHVIVRAELEGVGYALDATRDKQLGALKTLDQGSYGLGLLLKQDASKVVELPLSDYEWRKDFYDEFDLVAHEKDILFSTVAHYYGEEADSQYRWYKNNGLADVEKVFLDYYADFYPSIEKERPAEVEYDDDEARFTVKTWYRIVDGWEHDEEKNLKTIWALPYELRASFPVFSGVKRTSPYAIDYPEKIRQTLAFKVDDTYSFDLDDKLYETDAFNYREVNLHEDNVYQEVYTYTALQDHIAADDAREVLAFVNETRDNFGVTIQYSITPTGDNQSADGTEVVLLYISIVYLLFACALLVWATISAVKADEEWRDQLSFYPVPIHKFAVLTIATIGIYQIYWIYKNWLWVKIVQKEDIWPIPRAIFAPIMNFALFERIASKSDEKSGYGWFPAMSIPLACLYLLSRVLDNVTDNADNFLDWSWAFYILACLIIFPVVMQVNKYNEGQPVIVAKNGRYNWTSWTLIAVFMPINFGILFMVGRELLGILQSASP